MRNPYSNINWNTVEYLSSTTHWHATNTQRFRAIYDAGLRHFAISNYVPSHPTYPLHDNIFLNLSPEDIPEDIIPCPNSEKAMFADASMHIGSPGSFAATPGHRWDTEVDGQRMTWQDKFNYIFDHIQFEDGGGIVINHPLRNGMNVNGIIEKLMYDERVLGVEVVNHRSQRDYGLRGYYFDGWDYILSLGHKCVGFFNPDEHNYHPSYQIGDDMRDFNYGLGRNMLLVPQKNEHDALKAYRKGEFYGAFFGDRMKFTKIEMSGNTFVVETDEAERIDFISYSIQNGKIVKDPVETVFDISGEYAVNENTIFVRASAYEVVNPSYEQPIKTERLYTQPIQFKTAEQVASEITEQEDASQKQDRKKKFLLL